MLRLSLLVFLLTHRTHTAHVTDRPPHINRYERLYEKLEKLTNAPGRQLEPTPEERLYEKLDELNSLSPDLIEEDEDLLSAMQTWINAERMAGVVKEMQRIKEEGGGSKELDPEYDPDWNIDEDGDSESDYPMDANEDWESEDSADTSAISKPVLSHRVGVSPSAITRTSASSSAAKRSDENAIAAAEAIAATNARPKISAISSSVEEARQRQEAMQSYLNLWKNRKCQEPQPRWLVIRQLAPAADTQYLPPCVQLHRCAPDAGCCINESDACAPVAGETVSFPIALHKADGTFRAFKMQFFNHTRCACISRDKLRHSVARVGKASDSEVQDEEEHSRAERLPIPEPRSARKVVVNERQNDWREPTEAPVVQKDEVATAPPQLRRCTCPALFLANMSANEPCSCVCNWPDVKRRRDCQSLARGKENFGLRDRVCVINGDCTQPSCEHGAYDVQNGKCPVQNVKYPLRRYRRMRLRGHGRYQPEKAVVV